MACPRAHALPLGFFAGFSAPAAVSTLLIGVTEGILLQASVDPEFEPLAHWPGMVSALEGGLVG